MEKNVTYLPQFKGYGIADSDWKKMKDLLTLAPEDYARFGCSEPDDDAPIIGILMGREPKHYCINEDYVKALAMAGAGIVFLDYKNYSLQLAMCDGVLLPGGSFKTPEWYYTDAKFDDSDGYPNKRAKAYAECFAFALETGKPVLGICAGMQVIAAEMGFKLYRSADYIESPWKHKTTAPIAHQVELVDGTPFKKMMGDSWRLKVNSRHSEMLAPVKVQHELLGFAPDTALPLEVYAVAIDGVPEAIGAMSNGILGVQWHPENMAAAGDETQLRIFQWLVSNSKK